MKAGAVPSVHACAPPNHVLIDAGSKGGNGTCPGLALAARRRGKGGIHGHAPAAGRIHPLARFQRGIALSRTTLVLGLAGWLGISFLAAALGGVASANAGEFYESLAKPAWAPPSSVFGPVWSVLYLLIGIAAWLVWKKAGFAGARRALALFVAQLLANALWTWIFFAWRQGALAFAEILVLWIMIAATVLLFWRINRLGGVLLLPYLAWVSFAAALTYAIWQRNPQALG